MIPASENGGRVEVVFSPPTMRSWFTAGTYGCPGRREPHSTQTVVSLNSLQHAKLDILKAENCGKMRKFTEAVFQKAENRALPPRCNREGCKAEITGKTAGKTKPREH